MSMQDGFENNPTSVVKMEPQEDVGLKGFVLPRPLKGQETGPPTKATHPVLPHTGEEKGREEDNEEDDDEEEEEQHLEPQQQLQQQQLAPQQQLASALILQQDTPQPVISAELGNGPLGSPHANRRPARRLGRELRELKKSTHQPYAAMLRRIQPHTPAEKPAAPSIAPSKKKATPVPHIVGNGSRWLVARDNDLGLLVDSRVLDESQLSIRGKPT